MRRDLPTRLLPADGHTMFQEGLAGFLASYGGSEVVAKVPGNPRVLELARELKPDVGIMQVRRPFERAKETLRQMHRLPRLRRSSS